MDDHGNGGPQALHNRKGQMQKMDFRYGRYGCHRGCTVVCHDDIYSLSGGLHEIQN